MRLIRKVNTYSSFIHSNFSRSAAVTVDNMTREGEKISKVEYKIKVLCSKTQFMTLLPKRWNAGRLKGVLYDYTFSGTHEYCLDRAKDDLHDSLWHLFVDNLIKERYFPKQHSFLQKCRPNRDSIEEKFRFGRVKSPKYKRLSRSFNT